MKTLLLMRHAKSDWDASYGSDHERPLNDRGIRSAKLMGRLVAGLEMTALASDAGNWQAAIALESGLYGTGPEGALELAAGSHDVDRLMLVGHQPTWGMLVNRLTGAVADMKTASVAEINLPYFGSQWDLD